MLSEDIDRYLGIRRALGYKLYDTERRLRQYAACAADRGEDHVRTPTAVDWAGSGPTPHARHIRFRDLRRFSQFVHGEDPCHDLLVGEPFPTRWRRPVPYIYSKEEIAGLIEAATRIRPTWEHRRLVISTALGLIATTGLRASEALSLRIDDVHLAGHLVVRMTKFRKNRIVPLHATTMGELTRYLEQRRGFGGSSDYLFVSARRGWLPYPTLLKSFHEARLLAGIDPDGRRVPRIHDLRHAFATRALEMSNAQTGSLTQHHVALATYLGHARIQDTYWYMEATPELMTGIADASEKLAWEVRS